MEEQLSRVEDIQLLQSVIDSLVAVLESVAVRVTNLERNLGAVAAGAIGVGGQIAEMTAAIAEMMATDQPEKGGNRE